MSPLRFAVAFASVGLVVLTLAAGCGQSSPGNSEPTGGAASSDKASSPPPPAVKTVERPSDGCAWIPVSEVEQVVGKLEGPPRAAGDDECIYTLAEKSRTFTSMIEFRRKMREIDGIKSDETDDDLQSVVRVAVDATAGSVTGDLAMEAVGKLFARGVGQRPSKGAAQEVLPAGWDAVTEVPYTWIGRVGHISISVYSPPEITRDQQMALAVRVRDRIPDLPFPADNTYQIPTFAADRNPCGLLTRAEAEAVLGTLVVDPYRAIEETPLAYEKGKACAFFTPGHRAFIITPEWTGGESTFDISSGMGGLIGAVAPFEKTAIEGPWDKGRVDGTSGSLMFLKGDRFLRVDYLTSATDRAGALKLAAAAIQRLAS